MTSARSASTRKDATRNRDRLVSAARELIARDGLMITLQDVAQQAGVGVGTVYRHFPDKNSLLEILFAERMAEAIHVARAAADLDDTWHALTAFLEQSMQILATDRGACELLGSATTTHPVAVDARTQIDSYIAQIVTRAHRQHTLRPDVTASDIIHAQYAIAAVIEATRDTPDPNAYRRHLAIVIAGMQNPDL